MQGWLQMAPTAYLRSRMGNNNSQNNEALLGIGLALLAVVIWSGNFVVARGVIHQIPPGSLAFYRWFTATVVLFPFAIRAVRREWKQVRPALGYLFWTALAGITLFNTFVYIGAHYTSAINLALIGTTSSPVMAILLARIFLKEKLDSFKLWGLALCLSGVLLLLSHGDLNHLLHFRFTAGDGWILLAAFSFAVYNILVRRKPTGLSPITFLFMLFFIGTLLLIPFLSWDLVHGERIAWNGSLLAIILYLGIGTSVISFLCWNKALSSLGAGRTALFGNLIPVFSSLEAAVFLHEQFTSLHVWSMLIIFAGIILANWLLLKASFR
ncbi:MAG: DMT family transporter [Sphingobacteriales bacterium]|nr:DMT family transporter [Sphingobacteriales bacterium]